MVCRIKLIITQPNGIFGRPGTTEKGSVPGTTINSGRPLATTIGSEPHTTDKIQGDL